MAVFLAAAGLVVGVAGSAMQADASRTAGREGQKAKEFEAQKYDEQATASVGPAQREMLNEREKKNLLISRAQALAAFGGGSVSDPTVQNVIADIDNHGTYREAVALYQGEDMQRKYHEAAALSRKEGAIIRKGGQIQAQAQTIQGVSNAVSGASSMYSKYAAKGTLSDGTKIY